jgi:predicted HicB family RNase H-like nuclease
MQRQRWPNTVNLRIPEDIRKELEREAEYRQLSVSAVVREKLARSYEQRSTTK